MFRFLAGRILTSLISVFGATLAIFILVHVNPKDPRRDLRTSERVRPNSGELESSWRPAWVR